MDDCSAVSLKIGGEIWRADIEELAQAAYEDGAGEDYQPAEIEDLRRMIEVAAQNGEPVLFTVENAMFGALDALEGTCRELGLPYVRHTRACVSAWSEHVEFWNPEMHHCAAYRYACSGDGCPMLDYRQMNRLFDAGSLERELRIMEHVHCFPYKLTINEDKESIDGRPCAASIRARV